jgi:hypothetical protein
VSKFEFVEEWITDDDQLQLAGQRRANLDDEEEVGTDLR